MSDKKQETLSNVGNYITYLVDTFKNQIEEISEVDDKQDRMKLASVYASEAKIRIEEVRELVTKKVIDNLAAITLKDLSKIIDASNGLDI